MLNLDNDDEESGFKINKKYAERYENWRGKEELQKCNYDWFFQNDLFLVYY